jgi:hypothetical protein
MIQRTLGIVIASGLAATSAFASPAFMGGGNGMVNAGAQSENFNVPVPSNVNVVVNDPTQSSTANVIGFGSTLGNTLSLDVDFTGQGITGAASMAFTTEFILDDAAQLHINGTLEGLVGYELILRPTDMSFQIREYLDFDEFGFFGTLTDDNFDPVDEFNVVGQLAAGTYELIVSMRTESVAGQPFDGAGGFTVTLTTIPAPSAALAFAAPGLLLARRRRA